MESTSNKKYDIFLSYAREDEARAKALLEKLEAEDCSVWWDRETNLGTQLDKETEVALAASACVVVIWSKNSIHKDWVRAEAGEGQARKILIPVLIDDVQPPLQFRNVLMARLIGWPKNYSKVEYDKLLHQIYKKLGRNGTGNTGNGDGSKLKAIAEKILKLIISNYKIIFSVIIILNLLFLIFSEMQTNAVIKVTAENTNFNLLGQASNLNNREFLIAPLQLDYFRLENFAPLQFKIKKMVKTGPGSDEEIIGFRDINIEPASENASLVFRSKKGAISLQSIYSPHNTRFELMYQDNTLQVNFAATCDSAQNIIGLITVGDQFILEPNHCRITDNTGKTLLFSDTNNYLEMTASNLSYDIEFSFKLNPGSLLLRIASTEQEEKIILAQNLLVEDVNFLQNDGNPDTVSTTVSSEIEMPALHTTVPYAERYEFELQPDRLTLEELSIQEDYLMIVLKEKFQNIQPVREGDPGLNPLPNRLKYLFKWAFSSFN